ncbi:hypothetical protein [Thermococcus barophilus]|uniref:Uncharacterized protein n=1 Tax=Thermococcus barophilus TaxID=55802 RepID=A0A0S1XAU3_THEBA|nr:hypothetical protein [Thermococcus barophilus]ALM74848.1 hypothetical protein TBCH5v1_0896 [Thermococcus barophilus]
MSETPVLASEVFKELAEKILPKEIEQQEVKPTSEPESEAEKPEEEQPRRKRRYIGKSARINAELIKEVLRELKYIASTSYQPDVVKSAERAARFLKVIIAENEDLFPGVLKPKS